MKIIGATAMGIKLQSILTAHDPLHSDLNNIINKNIRDSDQWSKVYATHFNVPADIAREILNALREAFVQ